jgi:hypothetical protein
VENILNFHREWKKKNFLSCSLHWHEFNFCVAVTFLSINVYNRSHYL